ncbi:MAG: Gfo/Idh/MocA family oxidoreductase [Solimonas sp.]
MRTLKVGIISANWGAFAHLPGWRAVPGVEVVGICTSRRETAEAAAARFHIRRPYWDAQTMAADPDIDIVDCGTRPNLRHAMVLAALRNGKHVYNGIPFTTGLEPARELRDAWRASGKVAVVDAFSQWLPAHRLAREMIEDGFLGTPFGGTCFFNLGLFNQPNPQFPYNWFAQGGLGVSALRNLGSHALHVLLHLFGAIDELVAVDRRLLGEWRFPDGRTVRPETNDFASLLLRFASGMTMQLQVSWSATLTPGWMLEAFGSRGRFVARAPTFPASRDTTLHAGAIGGAPFGPVTVPARLRQTPEVALDADCEPNASHPMALSMQRMVAAIRGEGRAAPDFEQAWQVERVLEAARCSSEERRWVRLDEIV